MSSSLRRKFRRQKASRCARGGWANAVDGLSTWFMPARKTSPLPSTPVAQLWNLSPITAGWLSELGVVTFKDLQRRDLFDLWLSLKTSHRQVTRLMYFALWGAIHNCHWNLIPDEEKDRFEERRIAFLAATKTGVTSPVRRKKTDARSKKSASRPSKSGNVIAPQS